ncbi:MAG TPA: PQQ-dependent sugar dehydrogenase [Geminicoccaceae bacterium]|nr:PQQ-dependent sugar dehydrogenase [Geminicoccaceae bacterium]
MTRIVVAILLGCLMAATGAAVAQPTAPIRLVPVVARGLSQPLFVTHAGDGSGRLFVLEQPGRIRIIERGALAARPFLDITARVLLGGERGLLGLAFHPDYPTNGRYFVNYTRRPDGATVVAEFRVSPSDPDRSAPAGRVLLTVAQPFANHNGGMLAFGPDGFLYIALGDGGGAGDPRNRAQDPDELLGKILRIDVDRGRPYAVPRGNPFAAAGGGRPEIFALGLRNPWRFSFDREAGDLYAADVGQRTIEEVNVIRRGGNYGWRSMEGTRCFRPPTDCDRTGLRPPIAEYAHGGGRCSVTGGYVYRGRAVPALTGTYVYGDYCSGEVFGLRMRRPAVLLRTNLRIASFGEDEAGELYVVDRGGGVHRIAPAR